MSVPGVGIWYTSPPVYLFPLGYTYPPEGTWAQTYLLSLLEGTWDQRYLPPPPMKRMTDRCLWKHYLPATTVLGGNNKLVLMCYEGQSRNIIKCYCQRVNCSFPIYVVFQTKFQVSSLNLFYFNWYWYALSGQLLLKYWLVGTRAMEILTRQIMCTASKLMLMETSHQWSVQLKAEFITQSDFRD